MRNRVADLVFLLSAFGFTSAPLMSAHPGPVAQCHVVGDQMLPASSGGRAALCAEIQQAIASAAPKASYSVEVTVLSPSRLAAALVVNGRSLDEQRFAITDRNLNEAAIRRFAQSLAAEVAKAVKP